MRKKRLPVFVFVLNNVLGISLISEGFIVDSDKNYIEETKYYDLKKDCNGNHVHLSKNQNAKTGATIKN